VTAKKKGKAVITAKAGKKKLKCKITVKNASTLYIKVGETVRKLRYLESDNYKVGPPMMVFNIEKSYIEN